MSVRGTINTQSQWHPQNKCPVAASVYAKIFCGGHSHGETPSTIPNLEAKPMNADGTAPHRVWESRKPPQPNHTNGGRNHTTVPPPKKQPHKPTPNELPRIGRGCPNYKNASGLGSPFDAVRPHRNHSKTRVTRKFNLNPCRYPHRVAAGQGVAAYSSIAFDGHDDGVCRSSPS